MRFTFLSLLVLPSFGLAAPPVDYARDIKAVLHDRCFACHGALKQNAKLRLDSGPLIHKGGKSGPVVLAGKPAESSLFLRVSEKDESSRMPPEGLPLTADQIAKLKIWIDQGAKFPADDEAEADPRDHWAFRPPVRPSIPKADWGKNPVDAFLADAWKKAGVRPASPADKRLLLRRVYLDLIGLPPTPEQTEAFLNDSSSIAFSKVVDRLLESPQYGERWGRHFMDIWRYSDWWGLGAEVRNSQKHMWHFRDWIVESLNADKGYDQMIREMLAADELYPADTNRLRATGYLARQYFIFNRTSWLDETIEHTSKAFLGLTMNCMKCHDHKYDPFTQGDYYRMRAFFEPYQVRADMVPGEPDFEKNGLPRVFDCNLDAPTYKHERGDDRRPVTSTRLAPGIPALFGELPKIQARPLPPEGHAPHLRPHVEEAMIRAANAKIAGAKAALASAQAELAQAERLAAKEPKAAKDEPAKNLVKADFAKADAGLWEFGPGDWKHEKGVLTQSTPGASRSHARSQRPVPADFEAKVKFSITGGDPYRSVGLSFDVAGSYDVLVYASASGGKIQIAYKVGSEYTYPNAAEMRPFELNKPIELTVRVRGPLINVAVDGKHSIAYRLPVERKPGAIELVTFAATASFHAFELNTLPPSTNMIGPAGAKPNVGQAKASVVVAEKALANAEAQVPMLKAKFAAERAKYTNPRPELAKEAAKAERLAAVAAAEEELARAELEFAKNNDAKKREAAKLALAAAKKASENPGETYTAPRGALKTPESNLETAESRAKPFPTTTTGRRTALAIWMSGRENPLTARVLVNHVWMRHFGRPLVATIFDFGRKGAKPSHPELLDWLAIEFMEHGWSMKHLHRLLVNSAAYQLSATAEPQPADPENRLYWRRNPVRMEAQVIRDSMLHLAGQLDLTLGGPTIDVNAQADSKRRSLYFFHSHNEHHKFLMQFDDAAVLECYRRSESIVPQQALTLSNSKFALQAAEGIAIRIKADSDETYIETAFETILGYKPTPEEQLACQSALAEWYKLLKDQKHPTPQAKARANLVAVLLNHNDYVTVK